MRNVVAALLGLLNLTGSLAAKDAPLRSPEQRFADLAKAEEPSFRRHVVPLISRAGCNGRECHGSFQGRGGFQLSLFGYDFDKDLKQMTVNADGDEKQVRIDREHPEKSLLLTKGTNEEPHKGKERYKKGSWEYNMVLKWIQGGAKSDVEATGEFDRLEISPKEIVFKKLGDKVQLRVLAHWKDGTVEDVTQLTRFRSNDDSVSSISLAGVAEAKDKGDTHIVAFYDNGVHPIPVMLPISDKVGPKYPRLASNSKVDEHVVGKLAKLGIIPSEVCTDTEFLRRVSLDLTGTLPTPDQITSFLADKSASKRVAKVDELLKTPAYAAWWTTKLSDFLGNNPRLLRGAMGNGGNYGSSFSRHWYDWMNQRVAKNEPYDQMMAGIILATGRTKPDQTYEEFATEMSSYFRAEKPANFADRPNMPYFWHRTNLQKAEEKALAFSHSFLGVRIECAQCHKHPFDQWTQTDFKQFQAFFEGVSSAGSKSGGVKPTEKGAKGDKPGKEMVTYASLTKAIKDAVPPDPKGGNNQKALQTEFDRRVKAGEPAPWQEVYALVKAPTKVSDKDRKKNPGFDGRVLTPKVLGGDEVMLNEFPDPRAPLMEWLRSPKNPYFAKAWVNRVWASYFHRGLVEPADDMNLANPPVNGELMDYLADGFVKNGYNMAWLHREILTSATYQRSWKPNETNKNDEKNFSRFVIRRLPAEVVIDGITQATLGTERLSSFRDDVENRAIGPNANAGNAGKGGKGSGSNYSLNIFGKPVRETNCDCERTTDPTLLQTLFTRNDPELLSALEQAKGGAFIEEIRKATSGKGATPKRKGDDAELASRIATLEAKMKKRPTNTELETELKQAKEQLAKSQPKPAAAKAPLANADDYIAQVFLRTVSRPPTATEFEKARADLAAASSPADGVRELLWAMLNTREFMVNH